VTNRPPGRLGRPPLTERRKAATRLEIAREAVRLFTTKGVAATTAEEIANAAGISVRTLWRYFPTKESCVLPLLTTGIETTARALRAWPPGSGVAELVAELRRRGAETLPDLPSVLALVRLTRAEPALRAVWLRAHDDAEPVFAAALAERAGLAGDDLRIRTQAAMINSALRAAVEHHAQADPAGGRGSADRLIEAVRTALLTAAQGLPS
jgi:AcrR family transcriptional regulator